MVAVNVSAWACPQPMLICCCWLYGRPFGWFLFSYFFFHVWTFYKHLYHFNHQKKNKHIFILEKNGAFSNVKLTHPLIPGICIPMVHSKHHSHLYLKQCFLKTNEHKKQERTHRYIEQIDGHQRRGWLGE